MNTNSGNQTADKKRGETLIINENTTKMLLNVAAEGPAFHDKNGKYAPEEAVAEILEDVAAQLRSGTKMVDLHGDKLKAWNGQRAGAVLVVAGKSQSS
ncbi:MAG: hypothetical protein ACF788_10535 [Novipirellula sp. JB048]